MVKASGEGIVAGRILEVLHGKNNCVGVYVGLGERYNRFPGDSM